MQIRTKSGGDATPFLHHLLRYVLLFTAYASIVLCIPHLYFLTYSQINNIYMSEAQRAFVPVSPRDQLVHSRKEFVLGKADDYPFSNFMHKARLLNIDIRNTGHG